MPPPNSACIPFPAAPIISQFIHVWCLRRQKGRFQKDLWKIHATGAEKHKPAHTQGQSKDSPCDPHELAPAPEARFLLQHQAELGWPYPSPNSPATVCDSTSHSVSVRAEIFAECLGTCGLSPLVREPSAFSCILVVWELFELTPVATAALGKYLVKDEGKHTL